MPIIEGGVVVDDSLQRIFRKKSIVPVNGTSGTLAGIADQGELLIANGDYLYVNTNTKASPTWQRVGPAQVTVTKDLASIAANTTVDVTFNGAAGSAPVGTGVFFAGCDSLNHGLVIQGVNGTQVTVADQWSVRISNLTAGAIDAGSLTFKFLVYQLV